LFFYLKESLLTLRPFSCFFYIQKVRFNSSLRTRNLQMLAVESVLKQLKTSLITNENVILQAPPGSGKSTFLPYKMIKEKWFSGKIIMLEPRRLAAKNIAYYLASLCNEPVGKSVGYRMRGENKCSRDTKLEIVTEGILTRLLQNDPELQGVDLLIFDEFHERNIQGDLGLALALDAQQGYCEQLKILIMSATLDNDLLQEKLPDADFISVDVRTYPITFYHQALKNKRDLIAELFSLTKRALTEQQGDILVFVSGIKEIQYLTERLNAVVDNEKIVICPLYGALTLDEQQRALQPNPNGKRKCVVATNIAETSLTIAGITTVVDSGFERAVSFQAQSGIGKLQQQRISHASATQRAGRSGRTSAGTCYRLWSEESKLTKQSTPEIDRSDLTSLLLEVLNWGASDVSQLPFISAPPEKNILSAQTLLKQFTAIDKNNRITAHGETISALGVTPRSGHLLLKSVQLEKQLKVAGLIHLACLLVAVLESNDRGSDYLVDQLSKSRLSPQIKKQQQQLLRKLKCSQNVSNSALPLDYAGLLLAFAYPDRIAQYRPHQEGGYLLSNGVGATLFHNSSLIGKKMLVVADLGLSDRSINSMIYTAVEIDLNQLQSEIPHYFQMHDLIFWQLSSKRLIAEKQLRLGKLVISKTAITTLTSQQKVQAIITGLQKSGLSVLNWNDEDKQLLTRLRYAYPYLKDQGFADFSEGALLENIDEWLSPYLTNVTKPEQLKRVKLKEALLARLDWAVLQHFNKEFPTHIKVPTGSNIKITYRENEIPVLSVKMQVLFGQPTTPTICQGRIALQLALLSPAGRPLQLTQDLTAFWKGSYQEVKKEMKGRYPKHYWPDDPLTAQATNKTKKNL